MVKLEDLQDKCVVHKAYNVSTGEHRRRGGVGNGRSWLRVCGGVGIRGIGSGSVDVPWS